MFSIGLAGIALAAVVRALPWRAVGWGHVLESKPVGCDACLGLWCGLVSAGAVLYGSGYFTLPSVCTALAGVGLSILLLRIYSHFGPPDTGPPGG